MNVKLEPGRYVVAVSGGVDSMVLLDLLAHMPDLELTVAHFEHGIREESDEDRKLVEAAAASYKLPFIYERGSLGHGASEAAARDARYAFLRRVREQSGADAIVTAHHQDDLIETAVINMLRGTGRKGLSSLASTDELRRPLLPVTKQQLYDYAKEHRLVWHEDSTNQNDQYLRNYVRRQLLPRMSPAGRKVFVEHIKSAGTINPIIDGLLHRTLLSQVKDGVMDRRWFVLLPYDVSCEVMASWLRTAGIREFDRRLIERLVVAGKVAQPGKRSDINAGYLLEVDKHGLRIRHKTPSP